MIRATLISTLFVALSACSAHPIKVVSAELLPSTPVGLNLERLTDKKWYAGSKTCAEPYTPAIDVFRYNSNSYILRQNKCSHFEAPFMYLLIGEQQALLLDTGTSHDSATLPIYDTVNSILEKETNGSVELLVLHSHNHSDHYGGDLQFTNKERVTVIKPTPSAIREFMRLKDGFEGQHTINLGNRELTLIATPGHQDDAITLFDYQNKWLLTGDSLYPGNIIVKNWAAYKNSIKALAEFSENRTVSAVLGAHVEMNGKTNALYPIGSTYQPHESTLLLTSSDLQLLNQQLQQSENEQQLIFKKFVITPMTTLQRFLSNSARWIKYDLMGENE